MHAVTTVEVPDRLEGALLGTALGDALGAPFEGRRGVVSRAEVEGVLYGDDLLRWTDDTHMAIALAESLLACGGTVDPQHLGAAFAAAYHDQPWRGYAGGPPKVFALADDGHTYEEAARRLYDGGSFGNGGAMRCAPVAIVAHPDLEETAALAAAQARVTHAHPLGVDGAVLLAGALVVVTEAGGDGAGLPVALERVLPHLQTAAHRARLSAIIAAGRDTAALSRLAGRDGSGVAAIESVPAALAVFLAHHADPVDTIIAAVSLGGDTDTVAAMAGALAGAHHGGQRWPTDLTARLEDHGRLRRLAAELVTFGTRGG